MKKIRVSRRKLYAGFTLGESLWVLLICSFFLLLPVLDLKNYQESLEVMGFCSKLEKVIYVAQQTALVDGKFSKVICGDGPYPEIYFHSTISGKYQLETIEIPKALKVISFQTITFSAYSGNYTEMRSLIFDWSRKKQRISYKFLFGSGRYEKNIKELQ